MSCLILTPAEVLNQNAQMVSRSQRSPNSNKLFDGNATILALRKFNSPSQLWRGYIALAGRNLPFMAMQFPMFEHLRTMIHTYRKRRGIATSSTLETGLVTAISAGSVGSVAAVTSTPIDVVKTRIMLSASDSDLDGKRQVVKAVEAQERDQKAEIERAQQAPGGGRAGAFTVGKEVSRTGGLKDYSEEAR